MGMMIFISCGNHDKEFIVKGTTGQTRLNGNRVFLVPFGDKHIQDSIGVDSVVIENGEFEFHGQGEYLARITIDKHMRYGTQDLLVVTESGGEIKVIIDSVSSGGGTPQNEALQQWKEKLAEHNYIGGKKVRQIQHLKQIGDSAYAKALQDSLRQFNNNFKQEMRDIANTLNSGPAYDLLMKNYGEK